MQHLDPPTTYGLFLLGYSVRGGARAANAFWALKPHETATFSVVYVCSAMTVTCVSEVGDTVKDNNDSIRFLVLCQCWNLRGVLPLVPPTPQLRT